MLRWLAVLFVLAVITGVLGFTTIFGPNLGFARMLFTIYVGLAAVTMAFAVFRRA